MCWLSTTLSGRQQISAIIAEKAVEYGEWPKVILALDRGLLKPSYREISAGSSEEEIQAFDNGSRPLSGQRMDRACGVLVWTRMTRGSRLPMSLATLGGFPAILGLR
jgi:hypothetical protein